MKTTQVLAAGLVFGAMLQSSLFSQTVDFLVVSKFNSYNQTDNSTTIDAGVWGFEAHIEGTTLGSIATPTMTIPSGSGSTTLAYQASPDEKWFVNATFGGQGALDAAYGNGNYSLTALGQTITPISVTGDLYPVAPLATLSSGTISGGILLWNVSQALTITINGSVGHMSIDIAGNSYNNGNETFGGSSLGFTVPSASFLAGNNYTVKLQFDNIVGGTLGTVGSGALSGAKYAGVYNATTTFTIQAVPEPASYTAVFAAVVMAGAVLRRRRRQAA